MFPSKTKTPLSNLKFSMAPAGVRKSEPENNKLRTVVIMRICAARFLQKTRMILVISKPIAFRRRVHPATRRFGAQRSAFLGTLRY